MKNRKKQNSISIRFWRMSSSRRKLLRVRDDSLSNLKMTTCSQYKLQPLRTLFMFYWTNCCVTLQIDACVVFTSRNWTFMYLTVRKNNMYIYTGEKSHFAKWIAPAIHSSALLQFRNSILLHVENILSISCLNAGQWLNYWIITFGQFSQHGA